VKKVTNVYSESHTKTKYPLWTKEKIANFKSDGTHFNHSAAIYRLLSRECKVTVSRFA